MSYGNKQAWEFSSTFLFIFLRVGKCLMASHAFGLLPGIGIVATIKMQTTPQIFI